MTQFRTLVKFFAGTDEKSQRLIVFWAVTFVLYLLCLAILWFEVAVDAVAQQDATWLSVWTLSVSVAFYGLTRTNTLLKFTPSQLAFAQGVQAIFCIVSAYAMAAPVRGSLLTLLLVVLVFCSFALKSRRSHQLSALAIFGLGGTILWRISADPQVYTWKIEVVHFTLASSMIMAVVFLTSQFNLLRSRLKFQNAELEQQKCELSGALSRIEKIAKRDELTMLPNRRYMKQLLSMEENRHRLDRKTLCLALLDLDHFKSINDRYGHTAGDEVLVGFAAQVQAMIRDGDVLARWGGEEFLLLLPDTDQYAAMRILERVKKDLTQIHLQSVDATLPVTFSAGLSVMAPSETVAEAIRRADKAMYWAKASGRNSSCPYDLHMEAAAMANGQLKSALRDAIDAKQLVLHYQPQVGAEGKISGAEALVRWQHPHKGLLFPDSFISLAEESELIIALGNWVLAVACHQLSAWATQVDTAHLHLAVNVSAAQLRHPDFLQHILAVLKTTQIDPCRLKLELTESMLVEDVDGAVSKMQILKSYGVTFSVDDFGTGYSSLSYLNRLPLDEIKIDKSFVADISDGLKDGMLARAIISLAHGLGLSVIAEGVETTAQRDFLARHGCKAFQGYLFGRPVPIHLFESLLRKENTDRLLTMDSVTVELGEDATSVHRVGAR